MSSKDSQIHVTAYRHAHSFEEKKSIRNRVADLVVELFDVPDPDADPAYPRESDIILFRQISLFQPSDFDDLVRERNIDDRCGYALCPRPNIRVEGVQRTVWNGRGGKDFSLVKKEELEKWCSKQCSDRATFVRAQLNREPAWNREKSVDVRTLDEEVRAREKSKRDVAEANALTGSLQNMSLERPHVNAWGVGPDLADQLRDLAIERGEAREDTGDLSKILLMEKPETAAPGPPVLLDGDEHMIEGHRLLNTMENALHSRKFAEHDESDEELFDVVDGIHDDPDI